ncbi:spastin [Rhexocercosporidium sp. MPI-PUGE-AT-0058]|nr:spastin [Rhexocercosporidium sp. MPI-PUGE-AT-0058]
MHAVALHVIRTAHRPISRRACRIVAGCRRPLAHRNFHASPISYRIPDDPASPGAGEEWKADQSPKNVEPDSEEVRQNNGPETKPEIINLLASTKVKNGRTTSGRQRRLLRQKQSDGLPPVVLPEWFWKNNVKLVGDSKKLSGSLAVYGTLAGEEQEGDDGAKLNAEIARQYIDISECGLESMESAKYSIHVDVYREILATLRAGLSLRPPKDTANQPIPRPVTLLQCPKDGGSFYLDSIVETVASKLDADLIRLDAQDLAQIAGPYVEGNLAWHWSKTAILAYQAHRVAGKLEEYDKELEDENEDVDGAEEEEDALPAAKPGRASLADLLKGTMSARFGAMPSRSSRNNPGYGSGSSIIGGNKFEFITAQLGVPSQAQPTKPQSPDQWNDLKMSNLLDTLIDAPNARPSEADSPSTSLENTTRPLIVQVRDYKEMLGVTEGADLLYKLRTAINKKWQEGRDIILVGTTSSEEGEPALSRPDIQHLQSDIVDGEKRTIFVPPNRRENQDITFETDEKARIRTINLRNIEEMILKLADGSDHMTPKLDIEKDIDSATVFSAGLEDAVWTYARVHRTAMTILGLEKSVSSIDGAVFSKALKVLSASDHAKFAWGAAELKSEDEEVEMMLSESEVAMVEKKKSKDRLKEIRKKCNQQEAKLLNGVVLASDIRTTFADIRAPKETVEALKTLTSLSLIRPEAFSYGVLATDKIPGLLLYGPPGTGKTLLAKAVAKESGATVLEVTAADLNDMFVGQGEKNVRAVFTLAKKLSPCVVFIDEADAIFSARGEHNRNAHREMINQFLREWDGMNDFSAFIMVATNRPFDLDEAVLRRLPRRLLVDLPVEKDREAILKIHLKDEILDDSVSLSTLAKDTPFYSGSDLKNLSVAAALACIREENAVAAQHSGEEPYVYPEKRILTKAHFDKAMEEISASISEDMSTLTAIRKFDEKYGDRKGRKKKGPGMGFGGTTLLEKDSEAARVRKMEV